MIVKRKTMTVKISRIAPVTMKGALAMFTGPSPAAAAEGSRTP